jgi:hypothetical protein
MANSNNWGEIYKSTWWGDEDWSANSLKIDSAPPGFAFTGLLDTYTGAAAAYSVRKLSSTYTGDALRVRRSSDDTEQDIGFNASNELDTAALLSFVGTGGTDNGFVTKWYDQSGNSNDAINSDASEQPLVVSGGSVITENGKAAIEFDGVNDYLQNTSLVSSTPTTHYLIVKANRTGVLQRFFDGGVSSSTRHSIYQNGTFQYFGGGNISGDLEDTNQNLHYFLSNGTSSEIAINGATASTGSGGTNTLNGLTLAARWDGAAQWGDVLIQELIIFDSDQSSNRTGIETNINDHFDIYTP